MKVLDLLGRIKIAKPTYSALSETFKYLLKLCTDEDLEILVSDAKYLVKFYYDFIYTEYSSRLSKRSEKDQYEKANIVIENMLKETEHTFKLRRAILIKYFHTAGIRIPDEVIFTLLSSEYNTIRRIGYSCIITEAFPIFQKKIIENYYSYDDIVINFFLNVPVTTEITQILNRNLDRYTGKSKLTINERISRNKILIILYEEKQSIISRLKNEDPLSYIFIMKSMKKNIETDFLLSVYYSFLYKKYYLLKWFIELGNSDAVHKILEKEYEAKDMKGSIMTDIGGECVYEEESN